MASVLRFRALQSCGYALLSALFACGGHVGAVVPPPGGAERAAAADAAPRGPVDLPRAVHDLLLAAPSADGRKEALGDVVHHQLEAAATFFGAHGQDRALAATSGALALLRPLDFATLPFRATDVPPLSAAAREFSVRGDEGRARALYNLVLAAPAAEAAKAEAREHLAAIDAWLSATNGGTTVEDAGALERIAIRRRLLEPSPAAVDDAIAATNVWLHRATVFRSNYNSSHVSAPREEAQEAYRALETAGLVLAAIPLRDGDAARAVAALDAIGGAEVVPEGFYDAVKSAARSKTREAWAELEKRFEGIAAHSERRESELFADHDLFDAAALGIALEVHRLDPANPSAAFHIAEELNKFQMGEASPAVVAEAVAANATEPVVVGAGLEVTLNAMTNAAAVLDGELARRTFAAALPILKLAETKSLAGRVRPSAARVRELMGDIEVEQGRLDEARQDLSQSVSAEQAPGPLALLALIDQRERRYPDARAKLESAIKVAPDPAFRGELLLSLGEVSLSAGDVQAAKEAVASSVRALASATHELPRSGAARAERGLARALDRLGLSDASGRALERALTLTPHDKQELSQTINLIIHRALVRSDLEAAERGLSRAVAEELDQEELVYFALWVAVVEHQHHLPTSAACAQVFAHVGDDSRWISSLARFGEKKLTAAALLAKATTPIQQIEATFYGALERRTAGDIAGSTPDLESVAGSVGLQLSETVLARELVHGPASPELGALPADVVLP